MRSISTYQLVPATALLPLLCVALPPPLAHGAVCPCGDGSAVLSSSGDRAGERSAATPLASMTRPSFGHHRHPPPPLPPCVSTGVARCV